MIDWLNYSNDAYTTECVFIVFQLIASSTASSIFSTDEKDDAEGRGQKSIDAAMSYVHSTISEKVVGTLAQEQQKHDDMLM